MAIKQTEFDALVALARFDEARELLQSELASGRLLDPRSDAYWTRFADRLAQELQRMNGQSDVAKFWGSVLSFFLEKIEPVWGHAHKGHIYFRLGIVTLPLHLRRGKELLELAYQEDLALQNAGQGWPWAQNQSAYVTLAILERLDDSEFTDQLDKERFLHQLFESLDAVNDGANLSPDLIEAALKSIVPHDALLSCTACYRELQGTTGRMMPFASVALTGTLLEAIILGAVYYGKGTRNLPNGKDILSAELGALFKEAVRLSVFPNDSVRAVCRLIYMFRNRVHPGNEISQTYKLVPRVAWTLKVCFELALLKWAETSRAEHGSAGSACPPNVG